jgi:hypothetical protein
VTLAAREGGVESDGAALGEHPKRATEAAVVAGTCQASAFGAIDQILARDGPGRELGLKKSDGTIGERRHVALGASRGALGAASTLGSGALEVGARRRGASE